MVRRARALAVLFVVLVACAAAAIVVTRSGDADLTAPEGTASGVEPSTTSSSTTATSTSTTTTSTTTTIPPTPTSVPGVSVGPLIGGKGGGKDDVAQGGGQDASKIAEASSAVASAL